VPVIALKCRKKDDPDDVYWDVYVRYSNDLLWVCFTDDIHKPECIKLIRMIGRVPDHGVLYVMLFLYDGCAA